MTSTVKRDDAMSCLDECRHDPRVAPGCLDISGVSMEQEDRCTTAFVDEMESNSIGRKEVVLRADGVSGGQDSEHSGELHRRERLIVERMYRCDQRTNT